jgi:hypothetical protein
MLLFPGDKLGPYEILAPFDAGGTARRFFSFPARWLATRVSGF